MKNQIDIRDRPSLSGEEILNLNFINGSGPYRFRKYYRSGLRSHVFEVLQAGDIALEINGIVKNGVRVFPRAYPQKIFRIFRTRFTHADEIFFEINKYHMLLEALGTDHIALSEEFIVDYDINGKRQILLCGLQEYIDGEILDPWKISGPTYLAGLSGSFPGIGEKKSAWVETAEKNIKTFIKKIHQMIREKKYIPDLAGIGNLVLTRTGMLKLVDINNIVSIDFNPEIHIDDKGYPACDVSVHVLHMLETKLLGTDSKMNHPLYDFFLNKERKQRVKELEKQFYSTL